MSGKDERLAGTLEEEYQLMFGMYEEAITQIPESHWISGEIDYLIPARLIFHTIESTDFYTPNNQTGYVWEKRYDIDPEMDEIPLDKLPNQQQMLEYHHEVQKKVMDWLDRLTMDEVLVSEERFPWTGSTLLGRIMYILAHNRQHFGELNAELRRRNSPRIKWRVIKK